MPAEAKLNSIEFRVLCAQVSIRHMHPPAGDLQRLIAARGDQYSATGASGEIEPGSIASREVHARMKAASAKLNKWRETPAVQA